MRNKAKRYVKQGNKRDFLCSSIIKHAEEIAIKIGQEIFGHLNPECEIGNQLSSEDKVSFRIKCDGCNLSSGDGPISFSTSVDGSAHINGKDEICFPFTVDVSFKAFNFRELWKTKLEKRLSDLPDKFSKNHETNDKKRDALLHILYGLNVNMISENSIEFIEKIINSLEKSK